MDTNTAEPLKTRPEKADGIARSRSRYSLGRPIVLDVSGRCPLTVLTVAPLRNLRRDKLSY
jgi:hypothetical protein